MKTIFSKNTKITRTQAALGMIVTAQTIRLFDSWGHLIIVVFGGILVIFDFIHKDNK